MNRKPNTPQLVLTLPVSIILRSSCISAVVFMGLFFSPLINANDELRKKANLLFGQMPMSMPGSQDDTAEQIKLGERLYFETTLSINKTQSCNTCHNLLDGSAGVDNLKTSAGALGTLGERNTPSTWNAGFQFAQNWDASAEGLAAQARDPILSTIEMGLGSEKLAIKRLRKAKYKKSFQKAFPLSKKPLSFDNITQALAAFQRTLITKDRFDDYLSGDDNALNQQEKQGLSLILTKGCITCHSGRLMGGQFMIKMGLVNPYPNTEDKGRGALTGNPKDDYLFKVPPLRNVAKTAPFFHDGKGKSLEKAVLDTGWHQLGIKLDKTEVANISSFLRALNNTQPYIGAAKK